MRSGGEWLVMLSIDDSVSPIFSTDLFCLRLWCACVCVCVVVFKDSAFSLGVRGKMSNAEVKQCPGPDGHTIYPLNVNMVGSNNMSCAEFSE